jgi:hypothetical protein
MTENKTIIEKARDVAYSESDKFGSPPGNFIDTSYEKGQEIADKLGADKDIVGLGTLLMDAKLGEAKKLGKIKDHASMSAIAAEAFLKQQDVSKDDIVRVVDCIKNHHGSQSFPSLEAEICANADCYRFLLLKNWIYYLHMLSSEGASFEECLDQAKFKFEEKKNTLSLEICKEELKGDMDLIAQILKRTKL